MQYRFMLFFIVISAITPIIANAHVKWFTEVAPVKASIENILSPLFLTISLLAAIILAILPQVLPYVMNLEFSKLLNEKLSNLRRYSRYFLKYGTALALIIQVTNGTVFAPEFLIQETFVLIFVWVAIALLLIPHHFFTKIGAVVLLGLFIHMTIRIGIFHMLDYGFYVAIIGVLLVGHTKYESIGFPFLYLGTGLSLCWVAVEKWVYPSMSLDIVMNHGVPTFGFEPEIFIVLAAFVEFIVGYLLVVGILNRLLALVVTIIFVLTTMLFGITEIIGHFMIHVILIIFIIEGVSFYNPPFKMHKTKLDQMIFVFLNFIFVLSTFVLIYYRFA
ncbi:DoxX family membrane protein [Bacillus mesophilus]|uniref:DoxX family membrane protein n=1 Tax=Bacillus mesophilus TaxID=1808955 RepID=A0A6M0Q8I6_9BACI|nr:DoxX family membrane protein [Bacillus mesophilus]NEY72686.1 DoxX family membrane protein [Bacillus mesophilus]